MGKFIQDFGMQAAQGGLGAIMGLALGSINDKRQLQQQEALQGLEIKGQKEMTDYNMMKQLQMWKDTSYPAQMEQLRKAGLNPGLIYGMGGAGGQTTGQASGNVTGGHAPVGGGEGMAMMTNAIQMGLLKAQKENIEADTKNKLAQVPVAGAQATNLAAETALKNLQAGLLEIDTKFQNESFDKRLDMITAELSKTLSEADLTKTQGEIATATKQDTIKQAKAEAIGAILYNAKLEAETKNIKQDTAESKERVMNLKMQYRKMGQEIMIMWDSLSNETRNSNTLQQAQLWKELGLPEGISAAAAGAAAGILTRGASMSTTHNKVGFKIK